MLKKYQELMLFFPETPKDFLINYGLYESSKLVKLAQKINWDNLHELVEKTYTKKTGRPSIAPRIMFWVLFLKHLTWLSDKELLTQIKVNLEFQYFCWIKEVWKIPFKWKDSIAKFRKRLSENIDLDELQKTFLEPLLENIDKRKLKTVFQDSVVIEENIEYPTDEKLMMKVFKKAKKVVKKTKEIWKWVIEWIEKAVLRWTKKVKESFNNIRFAKWKKSKEKKKELREDMLKWVEEVIKSCKAIKNKIEKWIDKVKTNMKVKIEKQLKKIEETIRIWEKIVEQTRKVLNWEKVEKRLVSVHNEKAYACVKWKDGKKVEFGRKVHMVWNWDITIIWKVCESNEHDSKWVEEGVNKWEKTVWTEVDKFSGDKWFRWEESSEYLEKKWIENMIQWTENRNKQTKRRKKLFYNQRSYMETKISHFVIWKKWKRNRYWKKNFKLWVIMWNMVANYIRCY